MASDIAMMAAYAPSQEFLDWSQTPHPHDYSILHELNLMTEKIDSPAASQEQLPVPVSVAVAASGVPSPMSMSLSGNGKKRAAFPAKTELLYATTLPTSPVTEDDAMMRSSAPVLPPIPNITLPTNNTNTNINSNNNNHSIQSTPTPVALKARDGRIIKHEAPCPLPTPSKNQAAARRALRREARKRQRYTTSSSPAATTTAHPSVAPGVMDEYEYENQDRVGARIGAGQFVGQEVCTGDPE